MGKTIELTAGDGFKLGAYRADPTGNPKAGLVVIQELFGVNHHIRAVADRFAAEGYLAIAPALFDRVERNVELGYDPPTLKEAQGLRAKLPLDQTLADISAAVGVAGQAGKVGVVGYCWGGLLAFIASSRVPGVTAAVGYYGGGIANNLDKSPKVPLMLHFGECDQHIPPADVEKIRAQYPQLSIYTYPAGHGFNCDERSTYDKASADTARERTLDFFAHELA
jgi:carboxymethylenebutenolidase